ncbi:MerR family transcriptional regulator [Sphingomonas paeninsulae]|uniref:MerR family transcriptional regulator n=1 Tax=Sphingomonas paeninsulae TaxID=2319844 RepID=A0A494THD0_SPHPE|nr:MerR family transcriptional regulator [Sphingomonas paeninsulae]AYJ86722.1 MerR family transcriptional regulator [Sphingomonas paeninsulae]
MTDGKSEGAFLTIGELSAELGVPQHILRYWETRFPQLRPLTRAGNRRYYRPEDVALARRIHQALTNDGFTIKGVQKLLAGGGGAPVVPAAKLTEVKAKTPSMSPDVLASLTKIRDQLAAALTA